MLSTVKDANSDGWNRLFDLCHEVRANSHLTALEIRIVLSRKTLETRVLCVYTAIWSATQLLL